MSKLDEIWRFVRHNQATVVSVIVVFAIVFWIYGCESTTVSPVSEKKVTRGQLIAEADKFAADLALAYDDLDRQDEFKREIINMGVAFAEDGGVNPVGAGLSLLGIVSTGLLVDNRKKGAVIVSKTNAINAVNGGKEAAKTA